VVNKNLQGAAAENLQRQQVTNVSKKRSYNEITPIPAKRVYKKGDSDDENAPCHQESYNSEEEKEGGKSQDQYESDFINDDRTEEKALKKKLQAAKG
jgi:hypothetical protein